MSEIIALYCTESSFVDATMHIYLVHDSSFEIATAISRALALPFTLCQVHKLHMYGRWFVCCKSNNIDDVGSAVASNVEIPLVNTSLAGSVIIHLTNICISRQKNGFFVDKICKL